MTDILPAELKELKPAEMSEKIVKLEQIKKEVDYQLKLLKESLLEEMKSLDVLQLKTGQMTIFRASRKTVSVEDDEKAIAACEELNIPVVKRMMLDMEYMKKPIIESITNGCFIDGVELKETEYVSVRLTKEKE